MVKYGHVWLHLHLALLLAFAACLMFHRAVLHPVFERRTLALGGLLYFLACFTTWEPILAWPGLAIYAAVFRSRRALTALTAYGMAGALSVFGTFALYAGRVDSLVTRLVSRAMFRAGMGDFSVVGDTPMHEFANFAPEKIMSWPLVLESWLDRLTLLGTVGVFALVFLLVLVVRERPQSGGDKNWLVLAPLLAMWGLWFALMPQHAFIHEYQFVLGALPVALAGGFVAERFRLLASASAANGAVRTTSVLRAAAIAVPVCLLLLRVPYDFKKYDEFRPERNEAIQLGRMLRATVPENSIVLAPWYSMVATYYSGSHVIRGIKDAGAVRHHAAAIRALCDSCSYFAVLPLDDGDNAALGRVVWRNDRWRLIELGTVLGDAASGGKATP